MENNVIFDTILNELKLGTLTAQPQRVMGGYMHKMYKLVTTVGTYAVKLLNPGIMKRPDVFQNYQRAEYLEHVLYEHEIPVLPAMELDGHKMQCVNNHYFYVFQWVEGKALPWKDITNEHCQIAGTLLAKIHKIDITDITDRIQKPIIREELCIDWDKYIALANTRCPEIADEIKNQRELLYFAQKELNLTLKHIPLVTCICDGDMDSKNVLWVDGNPVIIDLESLDYGNPLLEMFGLALSWSGDVLCCIDYEFLNTFITSYRQEYGDFHVDWNVLYGIGFSWLEWLEYNIKRALMIECDDDEEMKLGIGQVHETIHRIIYYDSIKDELLKHLLERQ